MDLENQSKNSMGTKLIHSIQLNFHKHKKTTRQKTYRKRKPIYNRNKKDKKSLDTFFPHKHILVKLQQPQDPKGGTGKKNTNETIKPIHNFSVC